MSLETLKPKRSPLREVVSFLLAVTAIPLLFLGAFITRIAMGGPGEEPNAGMVAVGRTMMLTAGLAIALGILNAIGRRGRSRDEAAAGPRAHLGRSRWVERLRLLCIAAYVIWLGFLWRPVGQLWRLDRAGMRAEAAIAAGDQDELARLLDGHPKLISWRRGTLSRTLLLTAIHEDQHALVSFLIGRGFDVNVPEKGSGHSPLLLALYSQNQQTIELLLKAGADPTRKDHSGQSVLDLLNEWDPNSEQPDTKLVRQYWPSMATQPATVAED